MSIQRTLFLVSYCTYLLANGTLGLTKCGFPGKPPNGSISPEEAIYSENQAVTYSCPSTFSMFHYDTNERTCSPNGSWTGTTPICVPNIVYQMSKTITVYPSSGKESQIKYLVDELFSSCLELQPVGKTRWVRLRLERKLGVRLVWLHSRKFSVKVSVIDTLTNKSTICGSHEGNYNGSPISLRCVATGAREGFPGGIPGDSILIEELTAGKNPLVFCEILAYAYYGNTDCGLAEAPAFGSAEYVGPKRVEYKCQSGFTLIGPSYRYCDPDGAFTYWPRNTTPTCKLEKQQESFNTGRKCVNLDSHIANARIYYKFDGFFFFAIVECNDGFELMANKVLLCTSFGVWLGYADHGLHCKRKITCCEPPSVANTILANIQGYSEGSQAIYVCRNFAEPAYGQRQGISICQANGTWSDLPSKFICQLPTTTTTELVTVTSRSEKSTENLEYPNSTIHSLVESAYESFWKTAFIATVIGACISTILFSILARCYFCKLQQRRKTEGKSYDSVELQLHVE